jgi:hypothetical protein
MKPSIFLTAALALTAFVGCIKKTDDTPADPATTTQNLNFSFKFDSTQARLGNAGQPVGVPAGNAAQSPKFKTMAVHYIELCPDSISWMANSPNTFPSRSVLIYKGVETTAGGGNAIDFDLLNKAAQGQQFFAKSLKDIPAGTYKFIRVSVAYQNYDVNYNIKNLPVIGTLNNQTGRVASFLGFNSYIRTTKINTKDLVVNANKAQGFGAFETTVSGQTFTNQWQAPGTTVVNPVAALLGVPPNSCLVQGKFAKPLVITGKETADINTVLSFSTNKSFEWTEKAPFNGKLDFDYATPANSETVVDMGLRGLIARW